MSIALEPGRDNAPALSVVVVVYNMEREAPRTLYSLSADYQRNISAAEYEVIVVDNGSTPPFDAKIVESLKGNFKLIRLDPAPPSPAKALNTGLALARGQVIGAMIDGARIVTPGLLHFALHGARLYERSVVATLGWYLGHDLQRVAIECGYTKQREDELLASIQWPQDGYRLFEIATLDESSFDGWFFPTQESNALFMKRELWSMLKGFDESFDAAGGGLLNLDTFDRAINIPGAQLVRLLSEATFHQFHGGKATNSPTKMLHEDLAAWSEQYFSLRGKYFSVPLPRSPPTYLGLLPTQILVPFFRSATDPVWPSVWIGSQFAPPFVKFNYDLWTDSYPQGSDQPGPSLATSLARLAQREFRHRRYDSAASIARLIYQIDPSHPEARHILSLACGWLREGEGAKKRSQLYHFAQARAHWLLGNYRQVLSHIQLIVSPHWRKFGKGVALFAVTALSRFRHPADIKARERLRIGLIEKIRRFYTRIFLRN